VPRRLVLGLGVGLAQLEFTQAAHDKGVPFARPKWLLRAAREALPPTFEIAYALDPLSVKEGRWRDSEELTLAKKGFQGFQKKEQRAEEGKGGGGGGGGRGGEGLPLLLAASDELPEGPVPAGKRLPRVVEPKRFATHQASARTRDQTHAIQARVRHVRHVRQAHVKHRDDKRPRMVFATLPVPIWSRVRLLL